MPTFSLSLLLAVLPLAFAAPYHRPEYWAGCDQEGTRPCPRPNWQPSPSWPHGPYLPPSGSGGVAMPSGTGYGTGTGHGKGTDSWSTGTGYPVYPTGTSVGTGIMSILPIESSSSVTYTYSIRSTSSAPFDGPIITSSPPAQAPYSEPAVTTASQKLTTTPEAEESADTVKAKFAASTMWTFGASGALPAGLSAATDFIGGEPLTHTFAKSNVQVEDGFLVLNVPGGQAGKSDISSAEISTDFAVKYASVRTFAILTEEPGVCNGMFLYKSDSQETDIEWISDPKSNSNAYANNGTRAMQYTNQALNVVFDDASSVFGRSPDDATSAVHEYRLDWFEDRTEFFVDGVFQDSLTTNVPTEAGPWVWNNWADGSPNWTADPPVNDAPFKIQKIEMYYNPA